VLPIPSYARVTNLSNGRSVLVRINDRGPYMSGRVADLSFEAATVLGFVNSGSADVEVKYVGPAPLNGDDSRMLMASIDRPTRIEQDQGDTRIAFADTQTLRPSVHSEPTSRDPLSGGLVGDIIGMFGYAEAQKSDGEITAAIDAANAMATRAGALEDWKASVDDDSRKIKLGLGVFTDQVAAISIAEDFAMLGAVDEDPVEIGGKPATRLTLTHLKPGVARADVVALAQQLGLTDIVLY
jgi:peptidoglycan lytic transglycosylase